MSLSGRDAVNQYSGAVTVSSVAVSADPGGQRSGSILRNSTTSASTLSAPAAADTTASAFASDAIQRCAVFAARMNSG